MLSRAPATLRLSMQPSLPNRPHSLAHPQASNARRSPFISGAWFRSCMRDCSLEASVGAEVSAICTRNRPMTCAGASPDYWHTKIARFGSPCTALQDVPRNQTHDGSCVSKRVPKSIPGGVRRDVGTSVCTGGGCAKVIGTLSVGRRRGIQGVMKSAGPFAHAEVGGHRPAKGIQFRSS